MLLAKHSIYKTHKSCATPPPPQKKNFKSTGLISLNLSGKERVIGIAYECLQQTHTFFILTTLTLLGGSDINHKEA